MTLRISLLLTVLMYVKSKFHASHGSHFVVCSRIVCYETEGSDHSPHRLQHPHTTAHTLRVDFH